MAGENAEGRSRSRDTRDTEARPAVVDICLLTATVLSLVVLLGLYYGWPAVGGDLDYEHQIFIATPAILLLGTAGVTWAFLRALPLLRGTRSWSRWSAAVPAVVLGAILAVVLFPPPGFDDARPQLEAIAQDVLTKPESNESGVAIEGLDISRIERHGGAVYFIEADDSFGTTHGWVYSPEGSPEGQRHFAVLEHLGGPWYEFERNS